MTILLQRGLRHAAFALTLAGLAACASVGSLVSLPGGDSAGAPGVPTPSADQPPVRAEGKFVVIDVDQNELRFMDGETVLWSAPVGTGTGFRLRSDSTEWDFSTPDGIFYVQFKEENPVWILPDWYFVKNKLPIPPRDSPTRRKPGALGAAAVYLGHEIAIHGTDKPELLGQRVSHGCIRLSDENAKRLFHNVQIGTPVVITGGEDLPPPDSVATPSNPGTPKKPKANPLLKMSTAELFGRLDRQIEEADESAKWTGTASVLIARGLDDDAPALRGLLARAGQSGNERFEREYATFLADAFSRGSLRAVVSLARIDREERDRAAEAIVKATMDLYHGDPDAPGAPWPTLRVPLSRLGPEGSKGWKALQDAEQAYRETAAPRVLVEAGR